MVRGENITGWWAQNMKSARKTGRWRRRQLRGCAAIFGALWLPLVSGCVRHHHSGALIGTFAATGNMQNERYAFASARMIAGPLSGQILVTGGISANNAAIATASIYEPAKGTFTLTQDMTTARAYQTATALSDGTVLIVGGIDASGNPLNSAEIFNPVTATFNPVAPPNMAVWHHMAVPFCLEHSGTTYLYSMFTTGSGGGVCPAGYDVYVLIAGGFTDKSGRTPSSLATIYDPHTQQFTPVSSMVTPTAGAAAVLFPSTTMDSTGVPEPDILVIGGTGPGGTSLKGLQLYPLGGLALSPYGGTWHTSASFGLTTAVTYATATVLQNEPTKPTDYSPCNGFVVIAGGQPMPSGQTTDFFYLYQPGVEGVFGTIIGNGAMQEARVHHTATLLGLINNSIAGAGRVLIAGGEQNTGGTSFQTLDTAELYKLAVQGGSCRVGSFVLTKGDMTTPRWYHDAVAFRDGTGRVLIAGGSNAGTVLTVAEIFTP
jgi:hypothetical protein